MAGQLAKKFCIIWKRKFNWLVQGSALSNPIVICLSPVHIAILSVSVLHFTMILTCAHKSPKLSPFFIFMAHTCCGTLTVLRLGSAVARMDVCPFWVLWGRGLYDGPFNRPEESYGVWNVWVLSRNPNKWRSQHGSRAVKKLFCAHLIIQGLDLRDFRAGDQI